MPARLQLVARTGHPDFLDLPWDQPLERWTHERLVNVVAGIHRHVVRFVAYEDRLYALKELPVQLARKEYGFLRQLAADEMPVVEVVGVVSEREQELDAVLITRHLDYSLPFRTLFAGRDIAELRDSLLDAGAELLVRIHLAGFFWGDCSLSNILFRRDAGALAAYLVDTETGELHPTLSDGQRAYDLQIAEENVTGELLDIGEELGRPEIRAEETAAELVARYESLWTELTSDEAFGPEERFKIEEKLRRLNELGFDVEELELVADAEGYRLHLNPRVVEPGHHRRRLLMLTGLHAQENQARRLLNDLARFRVALETKEGKPVPETIVAYRWLAEVFHEILEHRWYLSQAAGRDVGILEAARDYVRNVLPQARDERMVLAPEPAEEDED
jgi:hypothetical protein